MKALLVSNGYINDYKKLLDNLDRADYIACADGGIRHLRAVDRKPDIIIGDLDSISDEDLAYIKRDDIEIHKFPSIKDYTDTELAAKFLIDKGYKEIVFMAVTGDRIDHSLGNIFLLNLMLEEKISARIIDDKNTIYLLDDYMELEKEEDSFLSIIAISEAGVEISLSGFFYDLHREHIAFGSTRGISNEIIEDRGIIQIHRGKALIIQSKD